MTLYPWQLANWEVLRKGFARIPNAWLLTGAEGIGKREFATFLAKSLLCDEPTKNAQACGQCESCRWFDEQTHPDYYFMGPGSHELDEKASKEDSKAKRKTTHIKVEQIRSLIDSVQLSAYRSNHVGAKRVVLIDPADSLNLASANALLKVLEEPPTDVIFILLAEQSSRLLPTIKSRCREFALSMPSMQESLSYLKSQGIAHAQRELAYWGGTPLFEHDPTLLDLRLKTIQLLAKPRLIALLDLAEQLDKQKMMLETPLVWVQKWCTDLLNMKLAKMVFYHPEQKEELQLLAQYLEPKKLIAFNEELLALVPFGAHTLNVRWQMEAVFINYIQAISKAKA